MEIFNYIVTTVISCMACLIIGYKFGYSDAKIMMINRIESIKTMATRNIGV